jgi:hypothetical protein
MPRRTGGGESAVRFTIGLENTTVVEGCSSSAA